MRGENKIFGERQVPKLKDILPEQENNFKILKLL